MILFLAMLTMTADEAPRETGVMISSDQPTISLQGCATRKLAKSGRVTPIPEDGATVLDWQITGPFSASQAVFSLRIAEAGGKRSLSPLYRHPFSQKTALRMLRDVAKECFASEYTSAAAANGLKPL